MGRDVVVFPMRLVTMLLLLLLFSLRVGAHENHYAEDPFRQLDEVLPDPNRLRAANGAPGPDYWQQQVDYEIDVRLTDGSGYRLALAEQAVMLATGGLGRFEPLQGAGLRAGRELDGERGAAFGQIDLQARAQDRIGGGQRPPRAGRAVGPVPRPRPGGGAGRGVRGRRSGIGVRPGSPSRPGSSWPPGSTPRMSTGDTS